MSTQAQIAANRLNAQRSTGPRTCAGKAAAAENSLKHGLSAHQDIITAESQAAYDRHRHKILEELSPVTPMESMLAERIISLSWRLKRTVCIQNQAVDALLRPKSSSHLPDVRALLDRMNPTPDLENDDLALGRVSIKDLSNARVLDRLLMHERRIENSLYKTILEFQRLSIVRDMQPQPRQLQSGQNDHKSLTSKCL